MPTATMPTATDEGDDVAETRSPDAIAKEIEQTRAELAETIDAIADRVSPKRVAQRVHKTPAQVVLAWAVQRGTALLTTSTTPHRIQENFDVSTLPEDAMQEIRDTVKTRVRFNIVVETGVPGFIPKGR